MRKVGKETGFELLSGIVAIQGYLKFELGRFSPVGNQH
jgi:hypothetical protein